MEKIITILENLAALTAIGWGSQQLWGFPVAALILGLIVLMVNMIADLLDRKPG